MNRIDRISAILIQLQSRRIVKAQDIADRFEISLRTVYRDINSLYEAGIPIIGEAGIGYSLADGYKLPPVMFTNEEASALLTAEKLVGKLTDKKTFDIYQSALTKIKAILKNSEKEYLTELDQFIEVVDNLYFTKPLEENQHIQDILRAIAQKTIISIVYFANHSQEQSVREIEPIGIFFSLNKWYLLAFCHLRNDYRQFRLDRIDQVQFSNQRFTKKHPSLKAYIDNLPERKRDLHAVTMRIDKKAEKYLGDQKYYMGYTSEQMIDNQIEVTFLTHSLEGFARWFMAFGDQAEIISPLELKEKIKTISTNILNKLS